MNRFTCLLALLCVFAAVSKAGCQTYWSPHKTFRLEFKEKKDAYDSMQYDVWVLSGKKRKLLPPQPVVVNYPEDYEHPEHAQLSNQFDNGLHISPNDEWIFVPLKEERRLGIGYLYKRKGPVDFRPATKKPFDILAWEYFARTEGIKGKSFPKENNPLPRIIEFKSWSKNSRYLYFSLKPVEQRHSKSFLWNGCFDTRRMRFVKSPK